MTSQANSNQGDKMRNAMIGQLAETPTSELRTEARYLGIPAGVYRDMGRADLLSLVAEGIIARDHQAALALNKPRVSVSSRLSSTTRGVCTKDVPTARGPRECGERANVTWTASYGGIRVEEGRCTLHNV